MNFISQLKANELDLELSINRPSVVSSIDGHQLQPNATVTLTIHLQDYSNKLFKTIEPMILTNTAEYSAVLGMPWLQQHNLIMHWSNLSWRLRECDKATLAHIALVNADLFHSIVNCKCPTVFSIQATALHCPRPNQHGNEILAAINIVNFPWAYKKYAQIFDKIAADKLPKHRSQDHTIDLANTNTPLFGLLYNLSTNKLKPSKTMSATTWQ